MIIKAEIGDFLYIIIFAILMLLGVVEKIMKAKRQQNAPPHPPHPYDDFEDVEGKQQTPPKTLEDMMKRMLQTVETSEQEKTASIPEEVQSLEYIPISGRHFHHPEEIKLREQSVNTAVILEEEETGVFDEYVFDIRQAVIASEILNKKY